MHSADPLGPGRRFAEITTRCLRTIAP